MYTNIFSLLLVFTVCSCSNSSGPLPQANVNAGLTIKPTAKFPATISAIELPPGFTQLPAADESFANWLGNVGLKKDKTVYLYNTALKQNQTAQYAVLDVSTGNKNLQQCADAVMRLRAEYLFSKQLFSSIHFTDNDGKKYQFTPPYTRQHFARYLEVVFGMCGSASLAKELVPAGINDVQAGDVFIRGGFPGHAVMVMSVGENSGGERIFMIAQGYMPAQDIHVLKNPAHHENFAWYSEADSKNIITPEYIFRKDELKRWK